MVLENGAAGVAWTGEETELTHLAAEGVADAPDAGQPRVTMRRPTSPARSPEEPLALPVRCSAACDVRAQIGDGVFGSSAHVTLPNAGATILELDPGLEALVSAKPTLQVQVRHSAPGARHATTTAFTVPLRRPSGPVLPRARDLVARRDGDDVVLTWRTSRDARRATFYAYLLEQRGEPAFALRRATGGPRRFEIRFRRQAKAKFVTLITGDDDRGILRRVTVPVQG